jgi:3-hydroxyacyl-CoA dehydrogenase
MVGHIAIVGAGLVGGGWAIVFARAGEAVRVYDAAPAIRNGFLDVIKGQLDDLKSFNLVDDPAEILARITVCDSLAGAVQGARFVQESVLEEVAVKQEISAAIGPLLDAGAVVGSSTPAFPVPLLRKMSPTGSVSWSPIRSIRPIWCPWSRWCPRPGREGRPWRAPWR